jgi:hypothetical protein
MSVTHGFCFAIGGFVSADGHHPIATEEQLDLHPEYLAAIWSTRVDDIEDKSKGDLLSKGLVLLQELWFTAQCLARLLRHLPLTELEVATLAFQFVNIIIWFLWLKKPLDMQQPIILGPADKLIALAKPSHRPSQNHSLLDVAIANIHILGGITKILTSPHPLQFPRTGPHTDSTKKVLGWVTPASSPGSYLLSSWLGPFSASSTVWPGTYTSPPQPNC